MNTAICLAITVVGWGLYHVFAKMGSRTLSPASMQLINALCNVVLIPIYYTLAHKTSASIKWNPSGVAWTIAAVIATTIGTFAYIYVLGYKDVSQVVSIATSYPILTMLVAILFMGESFTLPKLIGLVLVLMGVFISTRG